MRFALLLLLSSCASLRAGWARVTWVDGRIVKEALCVTEISRDGDVEMVCKDPRVARPRTLQNTGEI